VRRAKSGIGFQFLGGHGTFRSHVPHTRTTGRERNTVTSRNKPGVAFWATVAVGAVLLTAAARAQTTNHGPPELESLREQRLTKMRRFAESLTIAEVDGASERPVKLVSEPVLRFSDPDRLHSDGTLWVWGDRGRPRAFSEVFLKDDNESVLYHGVT